MKLHRFGLILLFSACLFGTAQANQSIQRPSSSPLDILFIQRADKGSIRSIANQPGYYQLQLKGVKEYIEYFSDRPARMSGLYPTDKFINRWHDGKTRGSFNNDPPNAALSAIQPQLLNNKMVNVMVQLSNPVYDAKQQTVTYTIHVLPGVKSSLPIHRMKNVVLFIDSYCISCVSSGF